MALVRDGGLDPFNGPLLCVPVETGPPTDILHTFLVFRPLPILGIRCSDKGAGLAVQTRQEFDLYLHG